jgi:site-specific DNA-methyltransferase (adenine-specific)
MSIMDAGESMKPITENTLFYGNNLIILREHIPNESVDLIYLDSPFNSNRNYFEDSSYEDSRSRTKKQAEL